MLQLLIDIGQILEGREGIDGLKRLLPKTKIPAKLFWQTTHVYLAFEALALDLDKKEGIKNESSIEEIKTLTIRVSNILDVLRNSPSGS